MKKRAALVFFWKKLKSKSALQNITQTMAAARIPRPRVAPNAQRIFKKKDGQHAWSVADFELARPHLTTFVRDELLHLLNDEMCRRVLIRAPVKSGKREIVEYIAQRDYCFHPHRVHAFLSAWHRTADEEQREELSIHNMRVFSMTVAQKAEECIRWIQAQITAEKHVVLHLDECDFGAGARQILGRVYTRFREHDSVTFFLYSATPQEVIFSGEVDEKEDEEYEELVEEIRQTGARVEYVPPPGYCGPGRFLEDGLIFEAQPFFTMAAGGIQLSSQGSQIITDFRAQLAEHPSRNIIVLRLSGGDGGGKDNKHIYQFLRHVSGCEELDDIDIIAAKGEKDLGGRMGRVQTEVIQWSNPIYWARQAVGRPMIYVIDQTASRSTEFVCHNRIFAYHDFRNTVVYTTISQAQERVNHYAQRYGGFQRIRVYGHKKTFQLSAGQIDYATYMTNPWYKRKVQGHDMYHIKSTVDHSAHPEHSQPMTLAAADRILKELASFVQVKVADRVKGRCKIVPVFGCDFLTCTPETFPGDALRLQFHRDFQNPFTASEEKGQVDGQWQGYLRGWGVFDYQHVETNRGWGMTSPRNSVRLTICYQEGILGIAVRWRTQERAEINTLQTYKSMYHH